MTNNTHQGTKPRVLFLCHGGTIGMSILVVDGHEVLMAPADDAEFMAAVAPSLQAFTPRLDIAYEFITSKDSTNVTQYDWAKLVERIRVAQDEEGYDAVAITHGTDTLAHTATALALALNGTDPKSKWQQIPVVITAAQNSIHHIGGDGRFNLENLFLTVIAAIEMNVAQVLVNFYDRVLLGSRVIKVSERRFAAMDSPSYPHVGEIDATGVHLHTHLLSDHKPPFSLGLVRATVAPLWQKGVVVLKIYPGLDPLIVRTILETGRVEALVLESLGEGNVCNEGDDSLIPVIEYATNELHIPVFISSQFVGGSANSMHYEVGIAAIKAGAIPCYDHTATALDVKVRWLLGNGISDFRQAMQTSFAGEVTQV